MKIISPLIVGLLLQQNCFADFVSISPFEIIDKPVKFHPMTYKELTFISDILYNGKLAKNLNCEIKVQEIKKEQKFLTGTKIIEMLEIKFRSSKFNNHEHILYFPVGGKLALQNKNSQFAGPVEEVQLHSEDLPNNLFIFHHDGQGKIIWMTFLNDLKTIPCGVED